MWTQAQPTEVGWYWCASPIYEDGPPVWDVEIVRLDFYGPGRLSVGREGDDTRLPLEEWIEDLGECWWIGPLAEPIAPETPPKALP